MTQTEFFQILGYLSSPKRSTKLDIETHPRRRQSLEHRYSHATGQTIDVGNPNYYVWEPSTNKWGSELRIYFNGDLSYMPAALQDIRVDPRPGFGYEHRVNNNNFVWDLIDYGFLLGDSQDIDRIRNLVPDENQSNFEEGSSII